MYINAIVLYWAPIHQMPSPGDGKTNENGLSTLRSQGLAEEQQGGQQLQSGFIKEEIETCVGCSGSSKGREKKII